MFLRIGLWRPDRLGRQEVRKLDVSPLPRVTEQAFDPAVAELPAELATSIQLCSSAEAALQDAQALVLATPWPAFRQVPAAVIANALRGGLVLDADRFLAQQLAGETAFKYVTVGRPVT